MLVLSLLFAVSFIFLIAFVMAFLANPGLVEGASAGDQERKEDCL